MQALSKRLNFHSTFSSTFDLKVEQVVHVYQLKISTITNICSLMRHYCACFHLTSSLMWPNESIFTQQQFFCSIFLTKIKLHSTSLDSNPLTQQGGQMAQFFLRFLSSKKSSQKSIHSARAIVHQNPATHQVLLYNFHIIFRTFNGTKNEKRSLSLLTNQCKQAQMDFDMI